MASETQVSPVTSSLSQMAKHLGSHADAVVAAHAEHVALARFIADRRYDKKFVPIHWKEEYARTLHLIEQFYAEAR